MLVPLWMSDGTGYDRQPGIPGHRPSEVGVLYSDDHGKTWRSGGFAARTSEKIKYPNETVAVELSDGRVLFNIRSEADQHLRVISISPDGVTNWSEPCFDESLLDPVCMGSIVRLSWPQDGRNRVLFANPDTVDREPRRAYDHPFRQRKNVSVQLSYDDCKTWSAKKVLEPGWSGYSDLQLAADGTILCLYEDGAEVDGRPGKNQFLTLARFNLEWVTDGKDGLP